MIVVVDATSLVPIELATTRIANYFDFDGYYYYHRSDRAEA